MNIITRFFQYTFSLLLQDGCLPHAPLCTPSIEPRYTSQRFQNLRFISILETYFCNYLVTAN